MSFCLAILGTPKVVGLNDAKDIAPVGTNFPIGDHGEQHISMMTLEYAPSVPFRPLYGGGKVARVVPNHEIGVESLAGCALSCSTRPDGGTP